MYDMLFGTITLSHMLMHKKSLQLGYAETISDTDITSQCALILLSLKQCCCLRWRWEECCPRQCRRCRKLGSAMYMSMRSNMTDSDQL